MNKLPRKSHPTLPVLNAKFQQEVKTLRDEWLDILEANASLAERTIRFGQHFRDLYEKAKDLDRGEIRGIHYEVMREQLADLVQTDNKSIWSKWNKIGEYAPKLLPYADKLPSTRDALYATAHVIEDGKSLKSLIRNQDIRPDGTVREIEALHKKRKRRKTPQAANTVMVTLTFDGAYDDVASALRELVSAACLLTISSPGHTLREALKAQLKEGYEQVAHKFH